MLIRRPDPIKPSEITSESTYLSRRDVVAALTSAALLPTSVSVLSLVVGWVAFSMVVPLVDLIISVAPEWEVM